MTAAESNLRLVMVRRDWQDLPQPVVPPAFSFRWYEPGDEVHWRDIHLEADWELPTRPGLFREQFGTDDLLLRQRQCYLLNPLGEAVGTATAWYDEDFADGGWGRVHWIAIRPAYQGLGLGQGLLTVACRRLRELGHPRAFLRTTPSRVPAINLYLACGFTPLPRTPEEHELWQALAPKLKYPVVLT